MSVMVEKWGKEGGVRAGGEGERERYECVCVCVQNGPEMLCSTAGGGAGCAVVCVPVRK